jgi:hypothetical protein
MRVSYNAIKLIKAVREGKRAGTVRGRLALTKSLVLLFVFVLGVTSAIGVVSKDAPSGGSL